MCADIIFFAVTESRLAVDRLIGLSDNRAIS